MALGCMDKGKRGITISVFVLGGALMTVFMAYLAFGDNNDNDLRTFRMIAIIHRHGDRTPTDFYPNDPYAKHPWPGGLGALTEKGSLQMFNLGRNLHMRYFRLLPKNGVYSAAEMSIISSAAERCLMSAQSFVAGFMPPLENRNRLPIQWQPVPVHYLPRLEDNLLAQKKPCRKYDEILKNFYIKPPPDVEALNQKNADLYKMLTKNTGKNITSILDVEFLFNTLQIEQENGLELPDWAEQIYPDKLLPLAKRSLALFTETPFMKRVKGGPIITEILDNMMRKRSGLLNPNRSIFIYSGHDISLVNVMRALGIIGQTSEKPDYASTLVFELHHSVIYEDDFEVKIVYYFDSEDKFPKEISIPNCESPCSLNTFSKSVKHLILENYDEVCQTF